jgi:RNA polymerase sigma-70 factor (ECF subfamily)
MHSDFDDSSDDLLIAGIANGRAEALSTLFRRRQGDVYRFALHMTGMPAVAEDVTQDVFMIVMRDAGRYQPGRSTAAAWLCGIARNCARQRLDRDRRLESLTAAADGRQRVGPIVQPDPVDELARAERVDGLRRAVLTLPVRYREVIVMCDLQELSYAEVADAIGCAIGTVRSRLHRARTFLAARIAAAEPPHAALNSDTPLASSGSEAWRCAALRRSSGRAHSAGESNGRGGAPAPSRTDDELPKPRPAGSQRRCLA